MENKKPATPPRSRRLADARLRRVQHGAHTRRGSKKAASAQDLRYRFSFVSFCDPMHSSLAAAASTAPRMQGGPLRWARQPVAWVTLWAVWCLLALGYFAYRNALDGLICRAAS
jgi:hypothetical protein